jgi:cation transport regulator ChaB
MKKIILFLALLIISLQAKHFQKEKVYQKIFCTQYNGIMEYKLKDKTRVDCLTKNYAIEVDWSKKWAESIGQSLHYALMTGKKPAIVVIQETKKDNHFIGRLKVLCKKYHITLFVINKKFEIAKIKL